MATVSIIIPAPLRKFSGQQHVEVDRGFLPSSNGGGSLGPLPRARGKGLASTPGQTVGDGAG
jgi:hypothetical protein